MKKHALFGLVLAVASMLISESGSAKDSADDKGSDASTPSSEVEPIGEATGVAG
jgi:hypothetical protein